MNTRIIASVAGFVLSSLVSSFSLAASDMAELESDCVAELGGEFLGTACEVTTVVQTPYSEMIRPSGKSGLGWTAVGVTIETTVDTYAIDVEESEEEAEVQVFVAGNPNLPGCNASGSQPKKCYDHYETEITTITVYTYSWLFDSSETTTEVVVTGCLNPGGRNMGMHKQCAN